MLFVSQLRFIVCKELVLRDKLCEFFRREVKYINRAKLDLTPIWWEPNIGKLRKIQSSDIFGIFN